MNKCSVLMAVYDLQGEYDDIDEAFIDQARKTLAGSLERIENCIDQLDETDIWWRPATGLNAIGNLILHLCGNVGQWMIAGVGGEAYARNRALEFACRDHIPVSQLMKRLRGIIRAADQILSTLDEHDLLEARHIQGYDTSVLAAILHVMTHFEGHAQEIVMITRLRKGEAYQYLWRPRTIEEMS